MPVGMRLLCKLTIHPSIDDRSDVESEYNCYDQPCPQKYPKASRHTQMMILMVSESTCTLRYVRTQMSMQEQHAFSEI